jgi:hypothetical protein
VLVFLIQHGWGRNTILPIALQRAFADGVIFGGGDEPRPAMQQLAHSLRPALGEPALRLLFDSQSYVLSLPDPNTKKLSTYPFGDSLLAARDFTARSIPAFITSILETQREMGFRELVAPTVPLRTLGDEWANISLLLAQEAIEQTRDRGEDRLFVSVVLSEDSLLAWEDVNDYLDQLTTLRCHGFYVTVARNRINQVAMESEKTQHLLQAIHSLAELNGYEVIVGYAGLMGVLYRTAGASTTAAGWYNTLRSLSFDRWISSAGGGRPPVMRFTSPTLLNNIVFETDLREFARRGLVQDVIGESPLADRVAAGDWTTEDDRLQFFWACKTLDAAISGTISARIGQLYALIDRAESIYERLGDAPLQPRSGPNHLASWRAAIRAFERAVDQPAD